MTPAEACGDRAGRPGRSACRAGRARPGWHAGGGGRGVRDNGAYQLKDRAATALDFLARPDPSPIQSLQIDDAARHLEQIDARRVAPFRMPRVLPAGFAALVLAVALLVWPQGRPVVNAAPAPAPPAVVEQAEQIREDLKQLDELAKSERNPELEKLVEELRDKAEEMTKPGVDIREALAKISEMQTAIAAVQAQFNVGLVDAQLQSLGEALVPAASLEAAGKSLIEAKFDKAAEKLDALENPPIERKEAKAVEEKLKQVAQEVQRGRVGLGELGSAASEMAEGWAKKGRFPQGLTHLAVAGRESPVRRKIKEILDIEVQKLSECKGKDPGRRDGDDHADRLSFPAPEAKPLVVADLPCGQGHDLRPGAGDRRPVGQWLVNLSEAVVRLRHAACPAGCRARFPGPPPVVCGRVREDRSGRGRDSRFGEHDRRQGKTVRRRPGRGVEQASLQGKTPKLPDPFRWSSGSLAKVGPNSPATPFLAGRADVDRREGQYAGLGEREEPLSHDLRGERSPLQAHRLHLEQDPVRRLPLPPLLPADVRRSRPRHPPPLPRARPGFGALRRLPASRRVQTDEPARLPVPDGPGRGPLFSQTRSRRCDLPAICVTGERGLPDAFSPGSATGET